MKKPNIPATNGQATPGFVRSVKDSLEIVAGRRGNRLALPALQLLAASAPPTQAECQALNAYVNEWAKLLMALISRLDDIDFVTIDRPTDAVMVSGTIARTNANDAGTASGKVSVLGSIAKTNANDTAAASGIVKVTGTIAKTNANDSVEAAGQVGIMQGTGELGDDELNGFELNGDELTFV